jgi:hypothetical protein
MAMTLPFTVSEFLGVFERYNQAIWPAQIIAYLAGLGIVALIAARSGYAGRIGAVLLAAMWLANGVGYHLGYFSEINRAALLFGGLFVVQAALTAWYGVVERRLEFELGADAASWTAGALVAYAMLAYPLLNYAFGHVYPAAPAFGVAPCPTTIFTLGVLLLARPSAPAWLFAIPLAWSAVGGSAAVLLGMREDFGLVAAGIATLAALVFLRQREAIPLGTLTK